MVLHFSWSWASIGVWTRVDVEASAMVFGATEKTQARPVLEPCDTYDRVWGRPASDFRFPTLVTTVTPSVLVRGVAEHYQ